MKRPRTCQSCPECKEQSLTSILVIMVPAPCLAGVFAACSAQDLLLHIVILSCRFSSRKSVLGFITSWELFLYRKTSSNCVGRSILCCILSNICIDCFVKWTSDEYTGLEFSGALMQWLHLGVGVLFVAWALRWPWQRSRATWICLLFGVGSKTRKPPVWFGTRAAGATKWPKVDVLDKPLTPWTSRYYFWVNVSSQCLVEQCITRECPRWWTCS